MDVQFGKLLLLQRLDSVGMKECVLSMFVLPVRDITKLIATGVIVYIDDICQLS